MASWPPRSPDLTPQISFYGVTSGRWSTGTTHLSILTEVKAVIRMTIDGVSPEICTGVVEEARRRLVLCAAQNAGRVESGWMRYRFMLAAEKNFKCRQSKWSLFGMCQMCSLKNIQQTNVALTFGTPGMSVTYRRYQIMKRQPYGPNVFGSDNRLCFLNSKSILFYSSTREAFLAPFF